MEDELAVFNGFLWISEGGVNSFLISIVIAFIMATSIGKYAGQELQINIKHQVTCLASIDICTNKLAMCAYVYVHDTCIYA